MAFEDLDDYSVGAAGSDTFDVVIPDLDPSTSYPIQFRWQFADKTVGEWSVSKILNTPEIARPESTNIVAVWNGTNLEITWDAPNLANGFTIYLTSGANTVPFAYTLDKTKTAQKAVISAQSIMNSFASIFPTTLTGLLKTTYIDTSTSGSTFAIPVYADGISGLTILDTDWLITSVDNGYLVTWTKPLYPTYLDTVVYEALTIGGSYSEVGSGTSSLNVLQPNTRYIKIRHRSISGLYSNYSNAKEAKAYDPIIFDATPPNDVSGVSAAWSNDDIIVSYAMPSSDPGARFEITLTNSSVSQTFFKWPSSQTGSGSVKITDAELFAQFGERYTSYTGVIKSIDSAENPTAGVSFTVPVKLNPLSSVTPTFSVTQISNGYTVTYSLPTGASYAKVYEGSTSGFTPNDSTNLVYSGISPAVVINTAYSEVFIKIKYFGIAGNSSLTSASQAVTPLEAGLLSLIDNEVKISTTGSILAGDSATSGGRAILNKTGLYVYNTGGSPTTQIIANATDGSPTLITTNAKIADWMIYASKIENTLHAGTTKYTGLSPSGTYAFWAGSTTASGDASAKFSVTPEGAVIARNISVLGGTLAVGANFDVTSSGVLTATSANITGTINAQAGIFKGVVDIGNPSNTAGQLRIQGTGGKIEMGQGLTFSGVGSVGIQGTAANGSTVNFYLSASDGYLFSQYGSIGGWTIDSNKLTSGGGASAVGVSADGAYAFYAGNATAASAPFRVTSGGAITATNADLTGVIKATSGKIGNETTGWNINGATLESYGTPNGTDKVILNSQTGEISGAKLSGANVVGGQFSLQGSTTLNKWNTDSFRAGGANSYIEVTSSLISIIGAPESYTEEITSYAGGSKIYVDQTNGIRIFGIPLQRNIDMTDAGSGGYYRGQFPLGRYPRQRTLVEDPVSGQTLLGMGVYYGSITQAPSASTGYTGDLFVSW
jgi:hypothetical protein